jgi:hypothetical protein
LLSSRAGLSSVTSRVHAPAPPPMEAPATPAPAAPAAPAGQGK